MSNTQLQEDTQLLETDSTDLDSSHLDRSQLDAIEIPSTKKNNIEEIPSDPVVIMQVLQVMDRERDRELRKLVDEREDIRDAVEITIDKVMKADTGVLGMLRVALRGRTISKDIGAELDILLEYEAYITQHIDKMVEVIQNCRNLAAKADVDADRKNRLTLRQRAVADLDNIREENKLTDLRARCQIFIEDIRKNKEDKA